MFTVSFCIFPVGLVNLICCCKNIHPLIYSLLVFFPQDQTDCFRVPRSVLLISERNTRHVVGVLRYLERTDAPLPPVFLTFAKGVHVAREENKTDQPFCSYLKSFGFCRYVYTYYSVQRSQTFNLKKGNGCFSVTAIT